MKELPAILKARDRHRGEKMALATIVKTVGSSYRRPGAHMLVRKNGQIVGSISGGCLEQDVIEHARKVIATGHAKLLSYDTTPEEDVLFGVGLGCKGVIEVWVEPVQQAAAMLDFVAHIFENGGSGVVATVFRGGTPMKYFFEHGAPGDGALFQEAQAALATGRSATRQIGKMEIFFEVIHAPTRLYIFGAGHDAIPLARLAADLGFVVTVIDRRPAYATRERFPAAAELILGNVSPKIGERSAAVVMSHHYLTDRDYLTALLPMSLRYLGLIGPRRRAESMLKELRDAGLLIGDDLLRKLYNPIGLDIGAEGPEEIALAILAEINAVLAGHGGGMLREKKGPIHAPRTEWA